MTSPLEPGEPRLDAVDEEILAAVERLTPTTLSSLARRLGWSKSMVHRRLRRLEALGLVRVVRVGGVVLVEPARPPSRGAAVVGVLRASEYPYLPRFISKLRSIYDTVVVRVYDEALQLAWSLARAEVTLAFIPAVTALLMHRATGGAVLIAGGGSAGGAGVVEGRGGEGHATTAASTMELCAVTERLPGPRVYASSGREILDLVASGRVRYGVLWEPYLTLAAEAGFRVRRCDVPFCCLLTVHRSLAGEAERLSELLADAIRDTRRGLVDLEAYSSLVGLDRGIVARTVRSYDFLEEPPVDELMKQIDKVREAIIPSNALSPLQAIQRRGSRRRPHD